MGSYPVQLSPANSPRQAAYYVSYRKRPRGLPIVAQPTTASVHYSYPWNSAGGEPRVVPDHDEAISAVAAGKLLIEPVPTLYNRRWSIVIGYLLAFPPSPG